MLKKLVINIEVKNKYELQKSIMIFQLVMDDFKNELKEIGFLIEVEQVKKLL